MSLDYDRANIPFAKALWREMTPQERRLWYDGLRRLPVRFQRQKAIGHYIADFYCHSARLVVELDGRQHYTQDGVAYDERRTTFLESQGIKVMRFGNRAIDEWFDAALESIRREVEMRTKAR